jgi:hypothetical protein
MVQEGADGHWAMLKLVQEKYTKKIYIENQ